MGEGGCTGTGVDRKKRGALLQELGLGGFELLQHFCGILQMKPSQLGFCGLCTDTPIF